MPKQQTDASRGLSEATETFLESLNTWLSKSTRKDLLLSLEPPIDPGDDGSEIAATLKNPAKQYYLTLIRYRNAYNQTRICVRAAELGQFKSHGLFKGTIVESLERERVTDKMLFSFLQFATTSRLQLSRVFFLRYEIALQYQFDAGTDTSIRFANSEHFFSDSIIAFPVFSSEPLQISV
jgi:hypothetical protein